MSRLRDIGWSLWDPIGLLSKDEHWKGRSFADEYDNYLLRVAGMVREGQPPENAIEYLIRIQKEYMGLDIASDDINRAEAVVATIRNDDQLWSDASG
jgi:hypothetical protein